MQRERGFSTWLVERRGDGAPLGICGLIKRDSLPEVDIGYAFRPAHWGQGYALEAAAAVLAHARDTLGLPALLGITAPANVASIALLSKIGLRFKRRLVLPPRHSPSNLYRIDFVAPGGT
jgi:RimJ/RimL family protein N-acetyltransferase